jgi:GTP cyclohydrolase II
VDANRLLGLPDDARDYSEAAAMLKDLGVQQVELLTNNPLKIQGLENNGIEIVRRRPHLVEMSKPAEAYVTTKLERMGHLRADEGAAAEDLPKSVALSG